MDHAVTLKELLVGVVGVGIFLLLIVGAVMWLVNSIKPGDFP